LSARIVVEMNQVAALFQRTDEELGRSIATFRFEWLRENGEKI
jgi:hypothetical protein